MDGGPSMIERKDAVCIMDDGGPRQLWYRVVEEQVYYAIMLGRERK